MTVLKWRLSAKFLRGYFEKFLLRGRYTKNTPTPCCRCLVEPTKHAHHTTKLDHPEFNIKS